MDIQARIAASEKQFDEQKAKRDEYIKLAEDCLTEMTKLQGEWRVLQDLLPKKNKKTNKANVIDVVPEEA